MSPSFAPSPLSESEQIEQLKQQLQWADLKIKVLEERLRLELIAKYGPASEKLNDAQLDPAHRNSVPVERAGRRRS